MKKNIFKKSLLAVASVAMMASCADYIDTDFQAQPDPNFKEPYKDYAPIKDCVDQSKYPNLVLGATLTVEEFNLQELAHAAAVTNFHEVAFGTSMMSGALMSDAGMFDIIPVRDLMDHCDSIGAKVFGSPLAANTGQATGWLNTVTAPIEIVVPFIEDYVKDFGVEDFDGTTSGGSCAMAEVDGMKVIEAKNACKITIASGFEVDPELTYTISFMARATKAVSLTLTFADNKLDAKTAINTEWAYYTVKAKPANENGYFLIDPGRFSNGSIYYASVSIGHYPDNHRPQTEQELSDTLTYALNTWCGNLMKTLKGRITSFDLIDEAIDENSELVDGHLDLKHGSGKEIYWQDGLGSENYAPAVATAARKAFEEYEGNASELKFFVGESNLDNPTKLESLLYWIKVWESKGAKIDGISAKLNISYYENSAEQSAKQSAIEAMMKSLAASGKMIRLCDFDINYIDAEGNAVLMSTFTDEQRAKLAAYYSTILKSYLSNVPVGQQYGVFKGNLADTSSAPVGLWSVTETKDWARTASYAAFCDAVR